MANLREAAQGCEGCDLFRAATQTVFGEGNPKARVMLVGEQPGDKEDKLGHPFVGPAGNLLNKALAEAGIAMDDVYITNAVKHFSFQVKGKLRIHKKPRASEIKACKPWLDAELEVVKPRVLVLLGSTAAQSRLGASFRMTQHRGDVIQQPDQPAIVVTWHPSWALRATPDEERRRIYRELVSDLAHAAQVAGS